MNSDHPDIVAPPPLLYLGGLLAVVSLDRFWPISLVPPTFVSWLAPAVVLGGLAMNVWAAYTMRRVCTAINPYRRTTHIVESGPFSFSRNPLYLGMDIVFAGAILWLNSLWSVPVFIVVLLVMHYGVIRREERYLEARFGQEYRAYRERVRRYI